MSVVIYCMPHARYEDSELVPAVTVVEGLSVCQAHGPSEAASSAAIAEAANCAECGANPRRAYFVVAQRPLCIRHCADAVYPTDDMRAHDMAHAAYQKLHAMGVVDVY